MNSKRRAVLQRKLSMGAVPRPPAGLADRIKNDIPKYLEVEPERQRFSRSVAFSMRVAASILLLITSVFVVLNFLDPDVRQPVAVQERSARLTPAVMPLDQPKTATAAPAAPAEEIRLEMAEEIPIPRQNAEPQRRRDRDVPLQAASGSNEVGTRDEREHDQEGRAFALNGANDLREKKEAPVAEPAPVPAPPMVAEAAPAVAPPPPPPAAAAARTAPTSLVREAYADGLDLGPKKNIFGISVDPEVFHHIKKSLESGDRPSQREVNVEALINYFAGAPARPPRRGVRLEVEASPAPVKADGTHAVLRFTIDTPVVDAEEGSIPPVARDVRVAVDFNGDAVVAFHRVGDDSEQVPPESVLLHNVSVTALYDIELRPRIGSSQRIATVRLLYRSLKDGRLHTAEEIVHGHDLAGSWANATRRHRLASLGAIWGESLKGMPQGIDVARRAEELVTQNPRDPLARELAHAASASGGER